MKSEHWHGLKPYVIIDLPDRWPWETEASMQTPSPKNVSASPKTTCDSGLSTTLPAKLTPSTNS